MPQGRLLCRSPAPWLQWSFQAGSVSVERNLFFHSGLEQTSSQVKSFASLERSHLQRLWGTVSVRTNYKSLMRWDRKMWWLWRPRLGFHSLGSEAELPWKCKYAAAWSTEAEICSLMLQASRFPDRIELHTDTNQLSRFPYCEFCTIVIISSMFSFLLLLVGKYSDPCIHKKTESENFLYS